MVKELIKRDVSDDNIKSNKESKEIAKLKDHMLKEEPYLDPNLSVNSLANKMNILDNELSVLINHHLNQHFFDFVNEYRIRKTMEILQDPNKREYTVLEILYEVGFNSKSSFNTALKKYAKVTPTEYRKTHLKIAS